MNNKNKVQEEWPVELRKAVEEYPRITASPDFNKRVLQALAAKQVQQSKLETFCDNLDRIFERPLLKLFGTAVLAIVLAWGGANLLLQCSGAAAPGVNAPAIPFNMEPQTLDSLPPHLANLYAQQAGLGLQLPPSDNTPPLPASPINPTDRKETSCSPNETILWG